MSVTVPIATPTAISTRALDRRDYLLVTIQCDGVELSGVGYSYAGTRGGAALERIVLDQLAPLLVDADARDIVALWEQMYRETLLAGRRGAVLRAISAVDIALWDLRGKASDTPVAVLLGGAVKPIPAYASGGYYRYDEGSRVGSVRDEIAFNKEQGFVDHKIKVGGLSVPEDAARVRAAVEEIDGGGRLALDANNAYRSVAEALAASRAFEAVADGGLWWIEEPLMPDDTAGCAELARTLETPVAAGEIHQTRWDFRQLIESAAVDILQPDAGVVGGITEWIRVARTAESFDVPIAPHWHANLHAHLAAASVNCVAVEYFAPEKDIYNFEVLLTPESRLHFGDGQVTLPGRPGLGIEFDDAAVDRYRTGSGKATS